MTIQNSLTDRGRSLEEDYFRRRDLELVEKLRKVAEAETARTQLGQKTGLGDPALLAELQTLGFTPATVCLLPLVPLVQTAWAEGGVTTSERELILALARARGIEPDSPAHQQLLSWMSTKPDEAVFGGAGRLISAMLAAGGDAVANVRVEDLVAQCEQIASASGGLFGLGRISVEEKGLLLRIAEDLKKH
jgi:hypothetical protein